MTSLGLQEERIDYLGWLDNPEDKILSVASILDPNAAPWAHAYEAMAAGVPIIFPKSDMGFGGLEDLYARIADSELVMDPAS